MIRSLSSMVEAALGLRFLESGNQQGHQPREGLHAADDVPGIPLSITHAYWMSCCAVSSFRPSWGLLQKLEAVSN